MVLNKPRRETLLRETPARVFVPEPAKPQPPQPVQAALDIAPAYRVIGVLLNTYILVEVRDALIMIDQHAAFERLKYEEYKHLLDKGEASQSLLVAVILSVSPREMAEVADNLDILSDAGYEIEPFGENELKISAVPHILGRADIASALKNIVAGLYDIKDANRESRRSEILQLSCKHAIKAGDKLPDSEVNSLIETMLSTNLPPTCPHGRPVARRVTRQEIEKMFKRV